MKKNIVLLFIFICFTGIYLKLLKLPPIEYWDEHVWIGQSFYLELFLQRDFSNKLWSDLSSYDQPKLAPYAYGILFYPKYLENKKKTQSNLDYRKFLLQNNFYFARDQELDRYLLTNKNEFVDWKSLASYKPQEALKIYGPRFKKTLEFIYQARLLSAIFLSFTVITVYLITRKVIDGQIALLVSFFFGLNTVIVFSSLKATSEAIFIFLLTIGVYFIISIFSSSTINTPALLIFSMVVGLASQTKLNGLMLLFFFNFFSVLWLAKSYLKKDLTFFRKFCLKILLVNLITFLVFVSLHPFLYRNPIKNSIFMYQFRYAGAKNYQLEFPGEALINLKSRINSIYKNFYYHTETNYGLPYIFFQRGFINYKNRVIFNIVKAMVRLRFVLLTFGFLILLQKSIYDWKKIFSPGGNFLKPATIFFTLSTMMFGLVFSYLLMDWMPYYIVLVYPIILFESIGLFYIMRFALSLIRRSIL